MICSVYGNWIFTCFSKSGEYPDIIYLNTFQPNPLTALVPGRCDTNVKSFLVALHVPKILVAFIYLLFFQLFSLLFGLDDFYCSLSSSLILSSVLFILPVSSLRIFIGVTLFSALQCPFYVPKFSVRDFSKTLHIFFICILNDSNCSLQHFWRGLLKYSFLGNSNICVVFVQEAVNGLLSFKLRP